LVRWVDRVGAILHIGALLAKMEFPVIITFADDNVVLDVVGVYVILVIFALIADMLVFIFNDTFAFINDKLERIAVMFELMAFREPST